MLLIPTIILIVCLLLAKFAYKGKWLWRFCLINVIAIVVYNLAGWTFMDDGGQGFTLILITILHIVLLFIVVVVGAISQSVKEQTYK